MAEEQQPAAEDPSSGEAAAAEAASPADESSVQAADAPAEPAHAEDPSSGEAADAATDGGATERRTLYRSSSDKVIAGVAGGIGAYFGIDSVIVRIAFILLTFLGGAGPFLYLIGWLALPQEDSPSIIVKALRADSPRRSRSLMAVVLIGAGLLITVNLGRELVEPFIDLWRKAPYLPLTLIAAGVVLVLWPGSTRRSKSIPARPQSPPPPPAFSASPPAAAGPEGSVPAGASPPAFSVAASTAAGPEGSVPVGAPPPPPARRRRGRSWIGVLTIAALFVCTGAALMLNRLDVLDADIGVFLAALLSVTGVGLVVSAFSDSARGLIWLGAAISVPLLLFVGAGLPWGSGVGNVRVGVSEAGQLRDEYRHGAGQMIVDLRNLPPDSSDESVALSLSVGEMLVYVPDNISTTADINVGAGNIRVWYGGPAPDRGDHRETWGYPWEDSDDGLGLSRTITVPVEGEHEGELRLDIEVGIGKAEVVTVPAPFNREVTS